MSKYQIPFLTACIQAFGRRFSMTRQAAYRYLHDRAHSSSDCNLFNQLYS